MSSELRLQLMALEREKLRRLSENRLARYIPYTKQRMFHEAGALYRERLFKAGNQLGKTLAGAAEMAMHLTGLYPPDWKGRRFTSPIRAIAGSESMKLTRDGVQRLLIGPPETEAEWGTGMVPRTHIVGVSRFQGVPNALEAVQVRHISGGISTVLLKSYDQGRTKWQADTVHVVWFDEEPPLDIYTEGLTRTNAVQGMVFLTFTPLLGMSSTVCRFLKPEPGDVGAKDRHVVTMTIHEALHYTAEQREQIIASYPPHERDARANGVPILGSGRVFPIDEERIKYDPERVHPLPSWYAHIAGIDFGWDHPTAVVWLAHDRDSDTVYIYDCYRQKEATPVLHAAAMRARGDWIPVAWPHDGLQHDKGSGEQLAKQYRAQRLRMLDERATWEDGSNGVEAGLLELLDRMQTGRLKVASHLLDWFEEFRLMHRKNGVVVKLGDDLISATRYALMMLRFAQTGARTVTSFEPGLTSSADAMSFEPLH